MGQPNPVTAAPGVGSRSNGTGPSRCRGDRGGVVVVDAVEVAPGADELEVAVFDGLLGQAEGRGIRIAPEDDRVGEQPIVDGVVDRRSGEVGFALRRRHDGRVVVHDPDLAGPRVADDALRMAVRSIPPRPSGCTRTHDSENR